MLRTPLVVLCLAALVVGLAGCGGTTKKPVTKAQYEQKLAKIGHELYAAANALGQSTATQVFNDGIAKLQQVVKDSAKALSSVKPPPDARPANHRLIKAYRQLVTEFEKVKAARRISFPHAVATLKQVQQSASAKETRAAAQELRRLGYKVPVFATL